MNFAKITQFEGKRKTVMVIRNYLKDMLRRSRERSKEYQWNGWLKEENWIGWQGHVENLIKRLEELLEKEGDTIQFWNAGMQRAEKKADDEIGIRGSWMWTLGSLFDGIGGFPLAAVHNGIKPVWASEVEAFPIRVTKIHFPEIEHLGDITRVDGKNIPPVDIICGGSPVRICP